MLLIKWQNLSYLWQFVSGIDIPPHVGDCPRPFLLIKPLCCSSSWFFSYPLFTSFFLLLALVYRGSFGAISSSYGLHKTKFTWLTSVFSLFPIMSIQDSSSSVGSGEFTGIKELDDISQEIAQLQR